MKTSARRCHRRARSSGALAARRSNRRESARGARARARVPRARARARRRARVRLAFGVGTSTRVGRGARERAAIRRRTAHDARSGAWHLPRDGGAPAVPALRDVAPFSRLQVVGSTTWARATQRYSVPRRHRFRARVLLSFFVLGVLWVCRPLLMVVSNRLGGGGAPAAKTDVF